MNKTFLTSNWRSDQLYMVVRARMVQMVVNLIMKLNLSSNPYEIIDENTWQLREALYFSTNPSG